MELPPDMHGGSPPVEVKLQPRSFVWRKVKGLQLKKLLIVCVGIGAGLGVGLVVGFASITWFTSRPIPPREWPHLTVDGASLKATLKTDWKDSVRYQLAIGPRSDKLKAAFDDAVRSNRHSISFTIHLYDKAGFEVCKQEDVKPTPAWTLRML